MYQIDTSEWSEVIHADGLLNAFRSIKNGVEPNDLEFEYFIRRWIIDGNPKLFESEPMVYEEIRRKIGTDFNTCPTNVGIVGSAKLGFSLTPRKNLSLFDNRTSDIDMFVVDENFFVNMCRDYDQGYAAFQHIKDSVSNARKDFLSRNDQDIRGDGNRVGTIRRGFIDSNKIPTGYQIRAGHYLEMCVRSLNSIQTALQNRYPDLSLPKQLTMRVYRDKDAVIRQYKVNLRYFVKKAFSV